MKINIILILLKLSLFLTFDSDVNYHIVFNDLFSKSSSQNVSLHCSNRKEKYIYYRGKLENIETVIKNKKYNSYSAVYMGENIDNSVIKNFPTSTIIFLNESNYNKDIINNYKDYCFVITNYNYKFESKNSYYINLYSELDYIYQNIIYYFIIIFSIILFIFIFIYCCFYTSLNLIKIYVNSLAMRNIYVSFALSISFLIFNIFPPFSLVHITYKSILIVDLAYLLTGYKIIYFHTNERKRYLVYLLIIFIEILVTLLSIYIKDLKKSFDGFYIYFVKILIEHSIILGITIKMFINNFIGLYKQYRLERRIRTILTLSYKYKLIIYSKVYIFSILYCLSFIILHLILVATRFNKYEEYEDSRFYVYCINIGLELFFIIIFAIIFFPLRNSLFYYFEVNYDYNSITFVSQIKSSTENNMKISNLKPKILKEKYLKHEFPLVLVEPFTKTNNLFNDVHIHVGIVKKN